MDKKYDVIIAGGGTAGCAAAYTAGKSGLKTLLVEKNIHLGGAITSALVVPAMKNNNVEILKQVQDDAKSHSELVSESINNNFFEALVNELQKLGGQVTYQGNKGWFNPELTKIALDNLMRDAGVKVMFSSSVNNVNIENNVIISVKILSEYNEKLQNTLSEPIETRYVIDTTGNCDVGKLCGCEFLNEIEINNCHSELVSESINIQIPKQVRDDTLQPVSLRFIMDNVDLKAFSEWILQYDEDRNVTTVEYINNEIHLSTAYTWDADKNWALKPLFDDAVEKGILKDTDRNYFQIFTVAGMPDAVAFNCPRMVESKDYSTTLQEARQSILRLSNFCKKYLKGFENVYISNIADELGIRVSNRIKGKYIYTEQDLLSGKTFENPVLISDYPIDVHSKEKDSSTLKKTGYYQLPIESLMSADVENLFVAGRCISADFKAQGALRIQPNCFSMGEAVAKYINSQLS